MRSGSGGLSPTKTTTTDESPQLRKRAILAGKVVHDDEILASQKVTAHNATCIARAKDAFRGCSPLQLFFWRVVGGAICVLCAVLYYAVPAISVLGLPLWLITSRASTPALAVTAVWVLLASIPTCPSYTIRYTKIYQSVALYFSGEVWFEKHIGKYPDHPKPIVWLMFPHGVISFGGWTFGALASARPSLTASASVLLTMPILKHVLGVFGLVNGSRSSLKRELRDNKRDICIYPGGVAELFLSSPDREQLYFNHRKGCIKLALETGSDINVAYLFGNTMMFRLLISQTSARLSRAIKSSLTLFWGRCGSPLPYQTKVVVVVGSIVEMPDYSYRPGELTMEVIEREHARVRQEVERIYSTYKHLHPGFVNKELTII